MSHKIFLSHNHKDKPVVEAVAVRLAEIFGTDQVFYDSWSIKPGDGIIDQMNAGLEAPEFVFFFVSANSLASEMVKLEWQNALHSATKGKTRIIPIRLDGCQMPAILSQTLYIDMHTVGLEAGLAQIVSVTQGSASFTPQHQGFSNLTFAIETTGETSITITIRASHFMEPNPSFLFLVDNVESEVSFSIEGSSAHVGGFTEGVKLNDSDVVVNAMAMRPMAFTLTPTFPLVCTITKLTEVPIKFRGVMHQVSAGLYQSIPRTS